MQAALGDRARIGAGTVLTPEEVRAVADDRRHLHRLAERRPAGDRAHQGARPRLLPRRLHPHRGLRRARRRRRRAENLPRRRMMGRDGLKAMRAVLPPRHPGLRRRRRRPGRLRRLVRRRRRRLRPRLVAVPARAGRSTASPSRRAPAPRPRRRARRPGRLTRNPVDRGGRFPGQGRVLTECVPADFVATGKLQETDGKPTPMIYG